MENIIEILKKLEQEHEIKIIYAVEAGSRAWGFSSEHSDYDIRFIFKQNDSKKYLSLRPIKENIDGFSADRKYDWQGWDITKALKLIEKLNPSIVEWIYSPIVYLKENSQIDFLNRMKMLLNKQKRIGPLVNYYRSMAKANFKAHISSSNIVKIKKYLYAIRPVIMSEWLLKCHKSFEDSDLIHVDFLKTLEEVKPFIKESVYENIVKIIEIKKLNDCEPKERIKCIDEWIEGVLENDQIKQIEIKELSVAQVNLKDYDDLLHSILCIKFE